MRPQLLSINRGQDNDRDEVDDGAIALLKDRIRVGFSCGQTAREVRSEPQRRYWEDEPTGSIAISERNPRSVETEWDLAEYASQNCDTADKLDFAELSGESAKACSLFELQQWHCRWPIGDPISEDFGFCGNRPVAGLPYCPAHAQMAYRPGTHDAVAREQRLA